MKHQLTALSEQLATEAIQIFGEEKAKGKQPLEYHMLMVSEISEATECARKNEPPIWISEEGKPEGEAVELADAVMRILNYCGLKGYDIGKAFELKREYNLNQRNWKGEGKNI